MTRLPRTLLALGLTAVFGPSAAAAPTPVAPADPAPAAAPGETVEVVFTTKTRPVRVRVRVTHEGKPLAERWHDELKKMFAAFDRNGDGRLTADEVRHVFPASGVRQLLANGGSGFAPNQGKAVILADLDADDDGKVTFAEFAAYYADAAGDLLKPAPTTPDFQNTTHVTKDLFARLDANRDGKLSAEEVKAAEKSLLALDSDEDECVSLQELAANPFLQEAVAAAGNGGMMGGGMMGGRPARFTPPPSEVAVYAGAIPGTLIQQLVKRYDIDADFELTRAEIGFDAATFARLDRNKDGKISPLELDRWRTGPPDAHVTLNVSAKNPTAVLAGGDGGPAPDGLAVSQPAAGRAVIRVGAQTLDVGVSGLPPGYTADQFSPARQYEQFFPKGKDFLEEKDIVAPQFQFLRLIFDAADFDGDGQLSRAELRRYGELQSGLGSLSLAAGSTSRTPNLFQLLDDNADGRLSLRELRTAWPRLAALEGDKKTEVTQAVLQPSAVVRVGPRMFVQSDAALSGYVAYAAPGVRNAPKLGPTWFWKMDRNGDGDVSQAEFLAAAEDFAAIDTDRDGLITLAEATAFDKKIRRPAEAAPAPRGK